MANRIIVNLDTSKSQYNIYECKQNDDLILEASIFENGIEKDVTTKAITINCTRADGTYVVQNVDITRDKNKIIANLKRDFTRVDGLDKLEIVLLENEKQNTTFDFNILVKPSVLQTAVEESKDTVIILEELGNKIVEAGQVKAETEALIQNGGAATKGDIANVNSQLEQKTDKAMTQNLQTQVNNLVLGAVGNGNNAEIIQARGSYSVLNDRLNSYEKIKEYGVIGIKSKNLFNKDTVTNGYYVANNNGNLVANANSVTSDYIPITPELYYTLSGTGEQLAFYNSNKVYVSGIVYPATFKAPANAVFVRLSMLKTQISSVQLEEGQLKTNYESFGVKFDENSIETYISKSKLEPTIISGQLGKNLFNKEKITNGYFVNVNTGKLVSNTNTSVSDYISILPSTNYCISGTNEQVAFYDTNKDYISGLIYGSLLKTTPSNAYYIRISMITTQIDKVQLEKGSVVTEYESYGYKINENQVTFKVDESEIIIKTVKSDGTGDYLSPKIANDSINDASEKKVYNIIIYPGIYTEVGWELKPFINLIGKDKYTCWIKGELPDNATDTQITDTSTIWVKGSNRLENLKITAKNMRYPIHDESGNVFKNWTRYIKNCHIEHYGNEGAKQWRNEHLENGMLASAVWTSATSYGMGHSSGAILEVEDTIFKARYWPFGVHNNPKFDNPCKVILRRCDLIKVDSNYKYALSVSSIGSGTNDRIILEGCRLNGEVFYADYPWLGNSESTSHIEFTIEGFGNSEVPYTSSLQTGEKYIPNFSDEYNNFTAQTDILKGQAVCFVNDYRTIKPMTTSDDISLFAGVSMENISIGELGKVKIKGFIAKSDLYNFSDTLIFGKKYGVGENGILIPNTEKSVCIGFDGNNLKII